MTNQNTGNFFVILSTPDGSYIPMMFDDCDIAKFETIEAARECAQDNPFGEWFGYEIFEIGRGDS